MSEVQRSKNSRSMSVWLTDWIVFTEYFDDVINWTSILGLPIIKINCEDDDDLSE